MAETISIIFPKIQQIFILSIKKQGKIIYFPIQVQHKHVQIMICSTFLNTYAKWEIRTILWDGGKIKDINRSYASSD